MGSSEPLERVYRLIAATKGRIDKQLVELWPRAPSADAPSAERLSVSRAEIRRWIEAGRVVIERAGLEPRIAQSASDTVDQGDALVVTPLPPATTSAEPDDSVVFDVVYEDAHLIVVDKPPHLVVHPSKGHERGTLVNGLLARGAFRAFSIAGETDGEGNVRPGIVHRIDKGTSGLLVVAKEPTVREALKDLFAAHDIDREYLAVVVGAPRDATIDTPHGRHPTDRLRFTSRPRGPSKRAVTHVRVLERFGGAALVACRLETGRTHQIRVHLAEQLGTPILGDPLYGSLPRAADLAALARALGRQALHARLLGFVHPITRAPLRWEREPPADMRAVLDALRAG